MAVTLPTVVTSVGLQPQTPASLNAQIQALAVGESPGLTINLPGILIEDIASTETSGVLLIDQARVEFVDSLTPYGANAFLLIQQGNMLGVYQAPATNTSVFVVFSGTPNFPITPGFIVGDGIYQYQVPPGGGGIVSSVTGISLPIFCVGTVPGSWNVLPGTITTIVTSLPIGVTLTCTNPQAGTPGNIAQTESDYRVDVLTAVRASAQGMATFTKTLLRNVPGVTIRLVGFQQQTNGGWKVLCAGGDPSQVAYAIYQGVLDLSTLVGSTLSITNITNASPGVITTNLNHGYSNGQTGVFAEGVNGMTPINGLPMVVTVIDEKNFSCNIDTHAMPPYTDGGVLSPNPRNVFVTINDYPDVYVVPFVNSPQQIVTIVVTWNTSAVNFVNQAAVQQLGAPAIATYINNIPVGQPILIYQLEQVFSSAIISVLPSSQLTRMVFGVSINGVGTLPVVGTGIVNGDPESYFYTSPDGTGITIQQG